MPLLLRAVSSDQRSGSVNGKEKLFHAVRYFFINKEIIKRKINREREREREKTKLLDKINKKRISLYYSIIIINYSWKLCDINVLN